MAALDQFAACPAQNAAAHQATHLADESAVHSAELRALDAELRETRAWAADGLVGASDHAAQVGALLEGKLPRPVARPDATVVLVALKRWASEELISQQALEVARGRVLRALMAALPPTHATAPSSAMSSPLRSAVSACNFGRIQRQPRTPDRVQRQQSTPESGATACAGKTDAGTEGALVMNSLKAHGVRANGVGVNGVGDGVGDGTNCANGAEASGGASPKANSLGIPNPGGANGVASKWGGANGAKPKWDGVKGVSKSALRGARGGEVGAGVCGPAADGDSCAGGGSGVSEGAGAVVSAGGGSAVGEGSLKRVSLCSRLTMATERLHELESPAEGQRQEAERPAALTVPSPSTSEPSKLRTSMRTSMLTSMLRDEKCHASDAAGSGGSGGGGEHSKPSDAFLHTDFAELDTMLASMRSTARQSKRGAGSSAQARASDNLVKAGRNVARQESRGRLGMGMAASAGRRAASVRSFQDLLLLVLPVVHPDSNWRMGWNMLIMMLVFISALLGDHRPVCPRMGSKRHPSQGIPPPPTSEGPAATHRM